MTAQEYSEFISWRVASLMSPDPSDLELIDQTEEYDTEEQNSEALPRNNPDRVSFFPTVSPKVRTILTTQMTLNTQQKTTDTTGSSIP